MAMHYAYECWLPSAIALLFVFSVSVLGSLRRSVDLSDASDDQLYYKKNDLYFTIAVATVVIIVVCALLLFAVDTLY